MKFHDYTLQADGVIRSQRLTETDALEPKAVQVFRDLIAEGDSVKRSVHPAWPNISVYWTSAGTEALATFYVGNIPATSSALLVGEEDRDALRQLADMLAQASHQRFTASLDIQVRPLIVSLVWPVPFPTELGIIADMETCLAAAYFLRESER